MDAVVVCMTCSGDSAVLSFGGCHAMRGNFANVDSLIWSRVVQGIHNDHCEHERQFVSSFGNHNVYKDFSVVIYQYPFVLSRISFFIVVFLGFMS